MAGDGLRFEILLTEADGNRPAEPAPAANARTVLDRDTRLDRDPGPSGRLDRDPGPSGTPKEAAAQAAPAECSCFATVEALLREMLEVLRGQKGGAAPAATPRPEAESLGQAIALKSTGDKLEEFGQLLGRLGLKTAGGFLERFGRVGQALEDRDAARERQAFKARTRAGSGGTSAPRGGGKAGGGSGSAQPEAATSAGPGGAVPEAEEAGAVSPATAVAVAVYEAFDYSAKQAARALDAAAEGARVAGDSLSSLASNDNLRGLSRAADGAGEALGKIPVVGQALESGIRLTTTAFEAAGDAVDAFVHRGRQLQDFSPELTAANVRADIKSLFADLKEANTLGPDLARLTEAEAELSMLVREGLLPIKRFVVETLVDVIRQITEFFREAPAYYEAFKQLLEDLPEMIGNKLKFQGEENQEILKKIHEKLEKQLKEIEKQRELDDLKLDDIAREQLDLLLKASLPGAPGMQIEPGTPRFPILGGF